MRPMRHGYTNRTVGDTRVVVKSYEGPEAGTRFRRELAMLRALRSRLPVAPLVAARDGDLTMAFAAGVHGQDLLDAGDASGVLRACAEMLNRIHAIRADVLGVLGDAVPGHPPGDGAVLVHGDYDPNNVLVDPVRWEVTAVRDWEWCHWGEPVEDLAWCEWTVRTHHPEHVGALGEFFDAYGGDVPPWPARQAAMLARCHSLREFCHRWNPAGPYVALWERRAATTADWSEH